MFLLSVRTSAMGDISVRDWTLSAIVTLATGQPVLLTAPNQTGSAFITPLPNRVCDGRSNGLASNIRNNGMLWFNTACFPVPPAGYFGNSGPTVMTGPGVNNWDVGLQKSLEMGHERRGSSYERTCSMRGTTRNSIDQTATPEQEQASGGSRRHCLRALSRSA